MNLAKLKKVKYIYYLLCIFNCANCDYMTTKAKQDFGLIDCNGKNLSKD